MSLGSKKVFTPTEQLVLLRDLTKQTGGIHEAQALQLRLWPFAIDPTLEKAEAHVGPEESPPIVRYVWAGSQLQVDRAYCDRVLELVKTIKFMLGGNWLVEIQRNGEVIFGNGTLNVDSGIVTRPRTNKRRRHKKRRR